MAKKTSDNSAAPVDRDTKRSLMRTMLLQRRFEEKCAEAYALGKIGGFCHLYIGQEAVSSGIIPLLHPDDYIVTAYRDHGQALARGMTPRSVMAELFGRATGCAGGKGGSMHLFDAQLNFLGGHGIVGGHIPLGAGVGYAIKYRGGNQVCICFFGEAAVNIGSFHEALNMASLWNLPVVFVIENNRYGMGTAIARAMAEQDVVKRAAAYAMDGESVDGQDVLAVRDMATRVIARARAGRPTLLEVRTTRFMGHSMSDAASGTYRPKEELEESMHRDPIALFRQALTTANEMTDDEFARMDEEIKAEVQDAWDFAENSPEPSPEELFTHVVTDTTSDTSVPPASASLAAVSA
jgi:pyruvate dehydrogenase E1 component alpha subunit